MRARNIMSSPATTIERTASVDECLVVLTRSGFSVLPVVDEKKQLVGIVSDGDLLRGRREWRPPGEAAAPADGTVADVMTTPATAMTADAEINDVASAMLGSGLRAIPIVHEGDVIGIVTRQDLVGLLTADPDRIADEVRHRLDVYGGPDRWTVGVAGGVVTVGGISDDAPESGVVTALAATVPGVDEVRLQH